MPVLRYFVVAGGLLLGGLFLVDAMVPRVQTPAVAAEQTQDSLSYWRAAEARKVNRSRASLTTGYASGL